MIAPLTGFYAAIFGVLYIFLASQVIKKRLQSKVSIGDGTLQLFKKLAEGSKEVDAKKYEPLSQAIRVHANFNEYVPIVLVLSGLLELNGANPTIVHAICSPMFWHALLMHPE
eukprot:TRINITY_DN3693_c0_g1_i1.p1 TRINITY_DN3693_c0_g1~~TRINITY_DN3693_c0_g1_i1.p1  ORF type:complete len:130 (+),score=45.66 TRINITY_DN3693_c0_g1_i1:53-391(+)